MTTLKKKNLVPVWGQDFEKEYNYSPQRLKGLTVSFDDQGNIVDDGKFINCSPRSYGKVLSPVRHPKTGKCGFMFP